MLSTIKNFFETHINAEAKPGADDLEQRLRIATVALLLETARADFNVQDEELAAVARHAQAFFQLAPEQTSELVSLAEQESKNVTSYYEFTSLINDEFTVGDKVKIIELMWQVAYADNELEKYEEALVRKIADLLYVPHTQFIAAKHRVKKERGLN
ncbi:MAG: TerB family tellurite resistance protein [Gammaproteobacteria bacterium]|jgi:uncharacterized tellurite resistance protein B-like protein